MWLHGIGSYQCYQIWLDSPYWLCARGSTSSILRRCMQKCIRSTAGKKRLEVHDRGALTLGKVDLAQGAQRAASAAPSEWPAQTTSVTLTAATPESASQVSRMLELGLLALVTVWNAAMKPSCTCAASHTSRPWAMHCCHWMRWISQVVAVFLPSRVPPCPLDGCHFQQLYTLSWSSYRQEIFAGEFCFALHVLISQCQGAQCACDGVYRPRCAMHTWVVFAVLSTCSSSKKVYQRCTLCCGNWWWVSDFDRCTKCCLEGRRRRSKVVCGTHQATIAVWQACWRRVWNLPVICTCHKLSHEVPEIPLQPAWHWYYHWHWHNPPAQSNKELQLFKHANGLFCPSHWWDTVGWQTNAKTSMWATFEDCNGV